MFRRGQHKQGYFDYHTTELGVWTDNLDDVIVQLDNIVKGKFKRFDAKKYFKYVDNKNCERNYNAIKGIK